MAPPPDSASIDRLIAEHADRAYAAAFRLTGNGADASDLVQETFVRVLEKAVLYDPSFDFGPWLHRMMFRVFLNRRRGSARRREDALEASIEPADRGSPDRELENAERLRAIEAALDALDDDHRACVVLVDIEGRDYREAAEILGWPVGSVAGRLFRARQRLRASLGERGEP